MTTFDGIPVAALDFYGEDRVLFASDYAIWQPKWLVEMFVDFQIPEDLAEYAPLTTEVKKKVLGLSLIAMATLMAVGAAVATPGSGVTAVPLASRPETFAPEMRDGFFLVPRLATHAALGASAAGDAGAAGAPCAGAVGLMDSSGPDGVLGDVTRVHVWTTRPVWRITQAARLASRWPSTNARNSR